MDRDDPVRVPAPEVHLKEEEDRVTDLIVALDGPPTAGAIRDLAYRLRDEAGIQWIKVGPLTRALGFHALSRVSAARFRIFYDEKLADHGPYVCESFVKRLADVGVAAVSTSTDEATECAVRAAEGTDLRVWRHVAPTSQPSDHFFVVQRTWRAVNQGVHGVICGAWHAERVRASLGLLHDIDVVCPGVRFDDFDGDEHVRITEPKDCARLGVTHVVVGRPIWSASDPVEAARRYLEALESP